ncbi:hypothetical protein RND71_006023 [Anisodus tanguticus]|uniref:Uncharacterized protein n=1 Tax=Anisodus tanguticus TaxID=243964 RepID=A0AAE1ST95_9SOLA|nr:hypothetical protein RND71_006023 [Anisodus tanguticus]
MAQQVKNTSNMSTRSSKRKNNNNGFSRKCSSLIKEQRLRRCATMLLCWYIQAMIKFQL